MPRRRNPPEPVEAQLSFDEMQSAIRKIDRRIKELEEFEPDDVHDFGDPLVSAIEIKLGETLLEIFGAGTVQYNAHRGIQRINRAPMYMGRPTPPREFNKGLREGVASTIAKLTAIKDGFEEKLEDAGGGQTGRPLRAYEGLDLHPEINRQVGRLYQDGHYSEAVEKSVKVLNNLVRLRSGLEHDGVPLMQQAFSKNNPVLRFNALENESDLNEQKGFMDLFCGAVTGLRNPRAHRLMVDNPERALEFIAFISLLAKLLDETEDNL